MKKRFNKSALDKVSFLEVPFLDGRTIPLFSCLTHNKEWELWVPDNKGDLLRLKSHGLIEGCYFAQEKASNTDYFSSYLNSIYKYYSFPKIVHSAHGIQQDILNIASSISKIEILHSLWLKKKDMVSPRHIATELEFLFETCRSIFDLLQESIHEMWNLIQFQDKTQKKTTLPTTFSRVVTYKDKVCSSEEIAKRLLIPLHLSQWYTNYTNFFLWLRDYRTKIVHCGETIDLIFCTDNGFAISTSQLPFSLLNIWNDDNTIKNELGSVRTLVSYISLKTLDAVNSFSTVITKTIGFQYDMAPNHNIYLRGHSVSLLQSLDLYICDRAWQPFEFNTMPKAEV